MNAALQTLQPLVRPGGMMLLLSDFSHFDERCELQLATIAARSDCRLLWPTDPLEASGLPRGQYRHGQIGRASWREIVCQSVYISHVAVSVKKKTSQDITTTRSCT